MKQTINFTDFQRAFTDYNREDNFSYEALQGLFDWLEEYEESTGVEVELDVIAICCEFTEYESLEELKESYTDIERRGNRGSLLCMHLLLRFRTGEQGI